MESQLVFISVGFVLLALTVGLYEILLYRKYERLCNSADDAMEPAAKEVDALHRQKFGRPSTELQQVFPRVREAHKM